MCFARPRLAVSPRFPHQRNVCVRAGRRLVGAGRGLNSGRSQRRRHVKQNIAKASMAITNSVSHRQISEVCGCLLADPSPIWKLGTWFWNDARTHVQHARRIFPAQRSKSAYAAPHPPGPARFGEVRAMCKSPKQPDPAQIWADIARNEPLLGRFRPTAAGVLSNSWRIRPDFGRARPNFGRGSPISRQTSRQIWPMSGQLFATSAKHSRKSAISSRSWRAQRHFARRRQRSPNRPHPAWSSVSTRHTACPSAALGGLSTSSSGLCRWEWRWTPAATRRARTRPATP